MFNYLDMLDTKKGHGMKKNLKIAEADEASAGK